MLALVLTDRGTQQDQGDDVDSATGVDEGSDPAGATVHRAPDVIERFLEAFRRESLAAGGGVLGRSELRCLERAAQAVGRVDYFAELTASPVAEDILPEPTAPAAWYADPTRRHQHRYWNGRSWTAHVADEGVTSLDHG
jgi:hypothetical protein